MRYAFPSAFTLDQCRAALAGRDEFIIKIDQASGIAIANYLFQTPDTFPDPANFPVGSTEALHAAIRRECRGLEFSLDTGEIVTRKFHKFFNCGQLPETASHVIDWSQPHWILDKLDGSMLTGFRHKSGALEWHTKMGRTAVAEPVEAFVENSPLRYSDFVNAMQALGLTPIFEWLSRRQRIVLDYPVDRLVLTAVRSIQTGQYMPYDAMTTTASQFGIPVVEALPNTVSQDSVQAFLSHVAQLEDAEGCVIRFASGHMVKSKAIAYTLIHGTKDALSSPKGVWQLYADDRVDDLLPLMLPDDRAALEAFTRALDAQVLAWAVDLSEDVQQARQALGDDRKRFAVEVVNQPSVPPIERGMLFSLWQGAHAVETVRATLARYVGTETRINEIRPFLDDLDWRKFYQAAPVED